MNGFERPEENWTSFPPGVFSPATPSRCSRGSAGSNCSPPVSVSSAILVECPRLRRLFATVIGVGRARIHLHPRRQLELPGSDNHLALLHAIGDNGKIALW